MSGRDISLARRFSHDVRAASQTSTASSDPTRTTRAAIAERVPLSER